MQIIFTWRVPIAVVDHEHEHNRLWECSAPVKQVFIRQNGDIQITQEDGDFPIGLVIPSTWVEDLIYVD